MTNRSKMDEQITPEKKYIQSSNVISINYAIQDVVEINDLFSYSIAADIKRNKDDSKPQYVEEYW